MEWGGILSAYHAIDQTALVIIKADADIISIQEAAGLSVPPYSYGSPDKSRVKIQKLVDALTFIYNNNQNGILYIRKFHFWFNLFKSMLNNFKVKYGALVETVEGEKFGYLIRTWLISLISRIKFRNSL